MDKLKYISFFFLIALSSCCRIKNSERSQITSASSDSINVRETISREKKTVISAADSAAIQALVKPCPDGKPINIAPIEQKSGRSTVQAEIKNGVLKAKCKCDTTAIQYEIENRLTETFKQRLNDSKTVIEKEVTKEVPYIPTFFWVMTVIGIASTIYGAFKLIYFFK